MHSCPWLVAVRGSVTLAIGIKLTLVVLRGGHELARHTTPIAVSSIPHEIRNYVTWDDPLWLFREDSWNPVNMFLVSALAESFGPRRLGLFLLYRNAPSVPDDHGAQVARDLTYDLGYDGTHRIRALFREQTYAEAAAYEYGQIVGDLARTLHCEACSSSTQIPCNDVFESTAWRVVAWKTSFPNVLPPTEFRATVQALGARDDPRLRTAFSELPRP